MQADFTTQPSFSSMTPEQHYSHAAQQMARACEMSLEEAEGWIAMSIRRAGGVAE